MIRDGKLIRPGIFEWFPGLGDTIDWHNSIWD